MKKERYIFQGFTVKYLLRRLVRVQRGLDTLAASGNFHGKFQLAPRRPGRSLTGPRLVRMQWNLHPVYIMQIIALLGQRYLRWFGSTRHSIRGRDFARRAQWTPSFRRLSKCHHGIDAGYRFPARLFPFEWRGATTRHRESHLRVRCSGKLYPLEGSVRNYRC